jgi:pyruvate ferredoxin oxidoreductase gamma subunit
MKTAGRVLGTAFFRAGFEVQDAPRYGAERRGAPIAAYVRADRKTIDERGPIPDPDLVVVADDTLFGVPAAGVLQGLDAHAVLLIDTAEPAETWRARLALPGPIVVLPKPSQAAELRFVGAACAGAAAGVVDAIPRAALAEATLEEYAAFGAETAAKNLAVALAAYNAVAAHRGRVRERAADAPMPAPDWIQPPLDPGERAAPAVFAAANSVEVRTGLWRSVRPVIDYDRCRRCWWVCSTYCPDNAIAVRGGRPEIDYDHCKGCMICVAQCPPHAIAAEPETGAPPPSPPTDRARP